MTSPGACTGSDHQTACALAIDTLARRRRVLGDDHLDAITSADNVAAGLPPAQQGLEIDPAAFDVAIKDALSSAVQSISGTAQRRIRKTKVGVIRTGQSAI
jgi:hypothetical protein